MDLFSDFQQSHEALYVCVTFVGEMDGPIILLCMSKRELKLFVKFLCYLGVVQNHNLSIMFMTFH